MTQPLLQAQDVQALDDITKILQRRRGQYGHAFVQGVYVKQPDGTWRNGFTRVTALQGQPAAQGESLDYGTIVYQEATVNLDNLQKFIETLAYEGVLMVGALSIPVMRQADIGQITGFRPRESLMSSQRWFKTEWPTVVYQYSGSLAERGLNYVRLVALDKPLYPDPYHLIAHRFDLEKETAQRYVGSVLLVFPNYQAKLAEVKAPVGSITLGVLLGTANITDVCGKVFAKNELKTIHKDVVFRSQTETFPVGFTPTEIEVCLLDSHDGELLDQMWLRAGDIGADSGLDESDPRAVQLLIQQGEGEQLELKPGKLNDKGHEELAETAVAFANRSGGRIVIGVADDGMIHGCSDEDVENRVTKALVDRCDPPVNVTVRRLLIDDRTVYIVIIPESTNKPHCVKGRSFFIRHGSNDFPMSRAELDEITAKRRDPFPLHNPARY